MKCPSCTAANVATAPTAARGITDQKSDGAARKRSIPVSLSANVCGKQNRLQTTRADTWFTILMKTITPAQVHSQTGISTTCKIRIAQQTTNDKSATLSRIAPAWVSAWSFLASRPSTMSLTPQRAYRVQNGHPVTSQSSRPMDPAILSTVMMFGKCFTLGQRIVNRGL